MSLIDIVALLVLFAAVFFAVRVLIRRGGCSGGCGCCPYSTKDCPGRAGVPFSREKGTKTR